MNTKIRQWKICKPVQASEHRPATSMGGFAAAIPRRWTLTCNKIVKIKYGTGKHRKMIRYDVPKTAAVETRWQGKNTWVRERT